MYIIIFDIYIYYCRSKVDHHNSLQNQLERERSENSDLKSKISRLETEVNAYLGNEHDMTDDNLRLRNQVELLKEEIKLTKSQLKKVQDNHDIILMQQKSAFTEEKAQVDHRLQELHGQLKELHGKYQRALAAYKKVGGLFHGWTLVWSYYLNLLFAFSLD